MPGSKHKFAFVVATKDRPAELRNMLRSLDSQSCRPAQIIIIDSSAKPDKRIPDEFPHLNITYKHHERPSASEQRNMGVKLVDREMDLIGFLDDDAILEEQALTRMTEFWENAAGEVGGAAFNMVNHPRLHASYLKSLRIVEKLGLYSKQRGVVLPSGFQTMIGFVTEDMFTQWLPTGATVWRKSIFEEHHLDAWFEGYSYLEDLDFSFRVGRNYRLAVVAGAKYYHYPAGGGRGDDYSFGRREVLNRIYFVKKNHLSLARCYVGLFARFLMSLGASIIRGDKSFVRRAAGNLIGVSKSFSILKGS